MSKSIAFGLTAFFGMLFSTSASATCSWTILTNGSTANATSVMNNLDCLAPLTSPNFTGNIGIGTSMGIAGLTVSGSDTVLGLGSIDDTISHGAAFAVPLQVASGYSKSDVAERNIAQYRSNDALASSPLELRITQIGSVTPASQAIILQTGHWGVDFSANLLLNPHGGNVGIGTLSPARALDIVGTIRQSGCTTAGTLSVNSSGDIICSSDARLKNIRGDFEVGLEAIAKIEPKLFTYKPTSKNPAEDFIHAGFIAQNVKLVIPQASAVQRDGYYSLDTTAILAASVNAIKELKKLSDQQAEEIRSLKADMAKMKRSASIRTASR